MSAPLSQVPAYSILLCGDGTTPAGKLEAPQSVKRALSKLGSLPGELLDPKHHVGSVLKTQMPKPYPGPTASGLPRESVISEHTLKVVIIRKFIITRYMKTMNLLSI